MCVLSCSVVSDSLQPCGLSLPGSSVRGIFQENFPREFFPARILERFALSCSRESSHAGVKLSSLVSPALAGKFYHYATWEAQEMYRIGKSTETVTGLVLATSWGGEGEQRVKSECESCLGRNDENGLELESGDKCTTLKVYEVLLDFNL